jgi:hypothetical protein
MNTQSLNTQLLNVIHTGLVNGRVIPYTGPGVLTLGEQASPLPSAPEVLVGKLTAKASVPHKIRNNLTAAAQFIENFKHRKTVAAAMTEAFSPHMPPTALHQYLAALPCLPLWVNAWYDNLPQQALAQQQRAWGMVQGVSQAEHFGNWVHYFNADGTPHAEATTATQSAPWPTLLYQPIGSVTPASNFLVSDSDYVEVLTEIDIQTPIPAAVQQLRVGKSFLFLGCRFNTQLERSFARQISKRSSDRHWAVLPEEPSRNEKRFMELYHIERIDTPLLEWVDALLALSQSAAQQRLAAN